MVANRLAVLGWRPAASSAAAWTVRGPESATRTFTKFIGEYELPGAFRGRGT